MSKGNASDAKSSGETVAEVPAASPIPDALLSPLLKRINEISALVEPLTLQVVELGERYDALKSAVAQKGDDDVALALQKQLAEANERIDQLAAKLAGGGTAERLERLERVASILGGIACEMFTNTVKSDITALQKELFEVLKPIRASLDAPQPEVAHAVA